MSQSSQKKIAKAALLFVLFILPAAIFYFLIYAGVHKVSRLHFYGPKTITRKMVRGAEVADTTYHQIPKFSLRDLTRTDSVPFPSTNLDGKLYLAHFLDRAYLKDIPKEITYAASEILPEYPDLRWITIWEHADSSQIAYTPPAERTRKLDKIGHQWIELTGSDSLVQYLRTEGYFKKDPASPEKFDPSSVVLVDKEGHIRSYFNPVMQAEISNIKKEILLLYKEYELAYKTHRFIEFED